MTSTIENNSDSGILDDYTAFKFMVLFLLIEL